MRTLLRFITRYLPKRVIGTNEGDYLERYYLFGDESGLKYFPGRARISWWQRLLTWLPCTYIHRFVRDDADRELHNHPWEATSLILAGGYIEERRVPLPFNEHKYTVQTKLYKPWSLNRIYTDTFHRVMLLEDDAWSVIVRGKTQQSWGFWDRETGKFTHWQEFVAKRDAA